MSTFTGLRKASARGLMLPTACRPLGTWALPLDPLSRFRVQTFICPEGSPREGADSPPLVPLPEASLPRALWTVLEVKRNGIANVNPTWKNMKRPSCLQKLVTGKPPWPRQGMSFRGPSQLGQRFPTKEQRKVTTPGRARPADPWVCAALPVSDLTPAQQRVHLGTVSQTFTHWAWLPGLGDQTTKAAQVSLEVVEEAVTYWEEYFTGRGWAGGGSSFKQKKKKNPSLLIYQYFEFFVKRKKSFHFTIWTKGQGAKPHDRENAAAKFPLKCKWLIPSCPESKFGKQKTRKELEVWSGQCTGNAECIYFTIWWIW